MKKVLLLILSIFFPSYICCPILTRYSFALALVKLLLVERNNAIAMEVFIGTNCLEKIKQIKFGWVMMF